MSSIEKAFTTKMLEIDRNRHMRSSFEARTTSQFGRYNVIKDIDKKNGNFPPAPTRFG